MKTLSGTIKTILTAVSAGIFTVCVHGAVNQPCIQITMQKTAPVLDGKLIEPSWSKATEMTEFVNWTLDSYIIDPVKVFLYYDEKYLYVGFRNSDPRAEELVTTVSPKGPHDTFLWGRNHVSVSISANGSSARFMADPKGTMTDWKNDDIACNGTWQYAASINETDWSAEYAIPLSEIGIENVQKASDINLSLSRSFPHGESSNWSGKCSFAGQSGLTFGYGRWPVPVPGKNTLAFNAANTGKSTAEISCELELIPLNEEPEFINQQGQGASSDLQLKTVSTPLYFIRKISIPAGGSFEEKLQYDLPHEGSYYASVIVKSKDGKILRRSNDFWFKIEPCRKKLADLRFEAGEALAAMARISNPVANRLRTEAEDLLAEITGLEKSADASWDNGSWDKLTGDVDMAGKATARLLHKVRFSSLHNWQTDWDFGISMTHSVIKLPRDSRFPDPLKDEIRIDLAGNEYESFQLAILPFGKNLNNITLWISDLSGTNGKIIPASNISVSVVDYNLITWQADYVARKGWHPDPLIPWQGSFNIDGQELCRPLWITVYAPPGTKPGDYSGVISVTAENMQKVTAGIKCRIWDFELPVVSHLKTHSWDQIGYMNDFYNVKEIPVEWYKNFCGLLLKNRFNPGSAGVNFLSEEPDKNGNYDFSRVEKVLSYCIDNGLTRFSMIQMKKGLYAPGEEEKTLRFIEAYSKFLKQKGWLDKALVELWDEPTDLEWPYIKERAEKIKKIDPDIRLQLFAEGGPYDFFDKNTDKYGLNNLVDIWAPVNIIESPETQKQGGEIWTYFCTLARESAPNFFIDCPAVYQRSVAWYCWMYGVDGFEHWSSNYYWRNVLKGKPVDQKWPNIPWDSRTYYYFNGEGQLVYPGPDGKPYSSVRLENFRDGMEDYEYLYRLRELLGKFSDDTSDPMLNQYRQLLNPEEYLLYKYPRKIKVTLENTLRYPDQPERILSTREKIAMAIEDLQRK